MIRVGDRVRWADCPRSILDRHGTVVRVPGLSVEVLWDGEDSANTHIRSLVEVVDAVEALAYLAPWEPCPNDPRDVRDE